MGKFHFGENRFIFAGPGETPPARDVRVAPKGGADAGGSAGPEAGKPAGHEVKVPPGAKGPVIDRTRADLDTLMKQLGPEKYAKLLDAVKDLGDKSFNGAFEGDTLEKSLNLEVFAKAVSGIIGDKDFSAFADLVGEKDKTKVADFISHAFAAGFINKLKADFKTKFPYFGDFVKDQKDPVKVLYSLKVTPQIGFQTEFDLGNFKDAYAKFADEKKKTEKPEDKKPEGPQLTRDQKIEALKKTPVATILNLLGYGKKDEKDGKTGYERIVDGEDFIGGLILYIFGYKEFVGESYSGVVDVLPDSYKNTLRGLEIKAAGSKLSAEKWRENRGAGQASTPEVTYEKADLARFVEFLSGKPFSEKGIVLEKDYVFGEGANRFQLGIDLSKGGKVVFAEGSFEVNGSPVTVEKGKTKGYGPDDKQIVVRGKLPAGTTISGKVVFS